MSSDADSIALNVLDEFRRLPAKRKPAVRDNGLHEWVPLSGIVAKGVHPFKAAHVQEAMLILLRPKLVEMSGIGVCYSSIDSHSVWY